jgi:signal transduction histidine kinase
MDELRVPATREPKSLSAFIQGNHREIIGEFSAFARTLMPPDSLMTDQELRDHSEELLLAIAEDLDTEQSSKEQSQKSRGHGSAKIMGVSGRLHADGRLHHGFTLVQVLAEFRALRASVLRLYQLSGEADLAGVRRFNEAIDEALTESMTRYSAQTNLYRDQFVGILSHDLRSPLGAITAGAALLAHAAADDQRQARVAARILNSAQRMERMIADLLDLTRTRLGGVIPLKAVRTDLQSVCEEVVLEVRASYPDAVVHFESRGNVTGNWDADRLAQVVSNLVVNAIEHGGKTPVTLVVSENRERVRLTVHNEGDPILPHAQGKIFEPLTRGTSDGAHNLGLGLFIARVIVVAHGGELRLSSSEESGTTFELTLPRDRKVLAESTAEAGRVVGAN